ncbi:MAG: hypothetical protein E6640_01990 [Actinomyces urogenitalis]|uniref:hypothetical protein n=1 Tax=Actinomyces urogenitalis TaxID=103621 RepID=UPI0029154BCD|nr:hypothetical protein [Actinomyces urogenitalis]MDU6150983.1 hypothetical protein [Actinomyces urogenitalis]
MSTTVAFKVRTYFRDTTSPKRVDRQRTFTVDVPVIDPSQAKTAYRWSRGDGVSIDGCLYSRGMFWFTPDEVNYVYRPATSEAQARANVEEAMEGTVWDGENLLKRADEPHLMVSSIGIVLVDDDLDEDEPDVFRLSETDAAVQVARAMWSERMGDRPWPSARLEEDLTVTDASLLTPPRHIDVPATVAVLGARQRVRHLAGKVSDGSMDRANLEALADALRQCLG